MLEDAVEIRTADGTADGLLFHADDGRAAPGVIHLTDIAGIRASHRDMARRLAAVGYTVLLPNVFYRTGRAPLFESMPRDRDAQTVQRFAELAGPLQPDAMERDVARYVDWLAARPSVASGPLGVVGYCFTGGMALRAAALRPERVGGAASFHGGHLCTDSETSPHHLLPRVKARLLIGHAIEDRSMPAAAIEQLDRALAGWGGRYESEVYPGAHHGWTVPDNQAYHREQAERAFAKLSALFATTLSSPRATR
jgi:carboxymethylenebutenolidase